MATYQTRHLEATREIQHGDKFFKPGETFQASEVDAEHYLRKGYAKTASAPAAPAKAAPAPAAKAPAPAPARPAPRAPAQRAAAPAPAPAAAPAEAPASQQWERTAPLLTKLADVPHPDAADTPPKG